MQILEDLWYGQICPIASEVYRDQEYRELSDLFESNKKKLAPTLNQKQLDDLQKMENLWEDMDRITQCAAFITGFRLAVQIMTASVSEDHRLNRWS